MIKLGIAFIVLLLVYLFFKEWRKGVKDEKKLDDYKDKITEGDDRLDELYVDNIVQDYVEEIRDKEDSLKDRITKFNNKTTEETKKDD